MASSILDVTWCNAIDVAVGSLGVRWLESVAMRERSIFALLVAEGLKRANSGFRVKREEQLTGVGLLL